MDISSKYNRLSSATKASIARMMQATIVSRALAEGGDSRNVHVDSDGFVDAQVFHHGTKMYQQSLINPVEVSCNCRLSFRYPAVKSCMLLSKMRLIKENWFSVTLGDLDIDVLPVNIRLDSKETADRIIVQVLAADATNIEFHPADKYQYVGTILPPSDMQACLPDKSLIDPDEIRNVREAFRKKYQAH